jgi:hypothetical protein
LQRYADVCLGQSSEHLVQIETLYIHLERQSYEHELLAAQAAADLTAVRQLPIRHDDLSYHDN